MATEVYVETIDSLGFGSFPAPVEALLGQLNWSGVSISGLERVVQHQLDVDDLPGYFSTVMKTRDWDDRLDRQLFGTICTFLHTEQDHGIDYDALGEDSGRYIRFVVETLENDREISLVYPGYKNRFDYDLRVDDWYSDQSIAQSPRHWHLFSDFFWKFKQSRVIDQQPGVADELNGAIARIYRGSPPRDELDTFSSPSFSVGRTLDALFGILPWFFMEEDINYPYDNADGKDMPYRVLERLGSIPRGEFSIDDSRSCSFSDRDPGSPHDEYHDIMQDLANYKASLQDNCDIVETVHSIDSRCPP